MNALDRARREVGLEPTGTPGHWRSATGLELRRLTGTSYRLSLEGRAGCRILATRKRLEQAILADLAWQLVTNAHDLLALTTGDKDAPATDDVRPVLGGAETEE